jgi:hypothetical protein
MRRAVTVVSLVLLSVGAAYLLAAYFILPRVWRHFEYQPDLRPKPDHDDRSGNSRRSDQHRASRIEGRSRQGFCSGGLASCGCHHVQDEHRNRHERHSR